MTFLILIQLLNLSNNVKSVNTFSFTNEVNIKNEYYSSPILSFNYLDKNISIKSKLRLNDKDLYHLQVNPNSVKAERAADIEKIKEFKFDPHVYERSRDYAFEIAYKHNNNVSLFVETEFIKERYRENDPKYVVSTLNELIPFSNFTEFERNSLNLSGSVFYNLNTIFIGLGVSNYGINRTLVHHTFNRPKQSERFTVGFQNNVINIGVTTDHDVNRLSSTFSTRNPINGRNIKFELNAMSSKNIDASKVQFKAGLDISDQWKINLGYKGTWYKNDITSESSFLEWQKMYLIFLR